MAKKNSSPSPIAIAPPTSPQVMMKQTTKLKKTKKNGQESDFEMEQEGDIVSNTTAETEEENGDDIASMKQFMAYNNKRVILNVGGKKFETYVDTCTKHGRTTMLGAMFLSLEPESIKCEYFLDRDPELFRAVLHWYRTGFFSCPPGVPREIMEKELEFYGIPHEELGKSFTRIFHLSGKKVWSCKGCGAHLTLHKQLHSKGYHGKTGDAYLFNDIVNVYQGDVKKKKLMSGEYLIRKVYCVSCDRYLGWKYETALGEIVENKYKEKKTILELKQIIKERQVDVSG